MPQIVSAVFDSHSEAERAAADLRAAGVPDRAISVIARDGGRTTATDGAGVDAGEAGEKVGSIVSKAAAGSGVGALLGIAALAIPGVGPLVAAGAIAEAAVGGAALTGTAIGAAAGGLSGLLDRHGVSKEDSSYYEERINSGGVFVSVDTDAAGVSRDTAEDILYRSGGHSSTRARSTSMGGDTSMSGGMSGSTAGGSSQYGELVGGTAVHGSSTTGSNNY